MTKDSRDFPVQTLSYWLVVAIFCVWVLSLPVYPSQDGPLHLYYANVLRHLYSADPGVYGQVYRIKGLITPYSLYYYALIGIGHFVGLERADEAVVCCYLVLFASSTRFFLRTVSPNAKWTPFLVLPVLLNWPLLMGFLNYSLSTCFALLALALWMKNRVNPKLSYQVGFLLLIAVMMITHPEPWLFVVGYAALDLSVHLLHTGADVPSRVTRLRAARPSVIVFVLALTVIPYIHSFDRMVQSLDPRKPIDSPLLGHVPTAILPVADRAQSIVRTLGIDVFGGGQWVARGYRFGIAALFFFCLIRSFVLLTHRTEEALWPPARVWALMSVLFFPLLLFAPDTIGEHFYFFSRLGILLYISALAGASISIEKRRYFYLPVAGFAYVLALFTVWLATRNLTPVARQIATLRSAPYVATNSPGLVMQPVGDLRTEGLNYMPFYWASAHYFRQRDLLMFNRAWLGDPIILVGSKNDASLPHDRSFYEGVPKFGSPLLPNDASGAAVFSQVGFLMMMRHNAPITESPLAALPGNARATSIARGWNCLLGGGNTWYLCQRGAATQISTR